MIVDALRLERLGFCRSERRQQERSKNSDNGNHYEQLNQSEPTEPCHGMTAS
jgi:hypothetical protein